jgi:hypothetical protein
MRPYGDFFRSLLVAGAGMSVVSLIAVQGIRYPS